MHNHRIKRRISIVDEQTLNELWYVRLSFLGFVTLSVLLFLLTLGILALLILFTPIRKVLPGYSENIRHELIEQTARVDSLSQELTLQQNYLAVIRDITAGEVQSDTVQTLDSLQLIQRTRLLQAKNEITEEFVNQYEQKEKDNLSLFAIQTGAPTPTLFRPVAGSIVAHYGSRLGEFGIRIQPPEKANIVSVLAGTVVSISQSVDGTYAIVVQHSTYLSIYRNAERVLKHVGDVVQPGETIAVVADQPVEFELWQNGNTVNPEDLINF